MRKQLETYPRLSRHSLAELDQISPNLRTIRKTGLRSRFGILVERRRTGQAGRIATHRLEIRKQTLESYI